jgi:hypothetical protein
VKRDETMLAFAGCPGLVPLVIVVRRGLERRVLA